MSSPIVVSGARLHGMLVSCSLVLLGWGAVTNLDRFGHCEEKARLIWWN